LTLLGLPFDLGYRDCLECFTLCPCQQRIPPYFCAFTTKLPSDVCSV
jgi:hypothetical protein